MLARDSSCAWQELSGQTAVNIGQPVFVVGSTVQRTFPITGLEPGLYKVKVWGLIVHPDGQDSSNQPKSVEVTSAQTLSIDRHSDSTKVYMRDGTIAVGAPGERETAC